MSDPPVGSFGTIEDLPPLSGVALDLPASTFGDHSPEGALRVRRRRPDGEAETVRLAAAVAGEWAVHEGDIILGAADLLRADDDRDLLGLRVVQAGSIWPGGRLPCRVPTSLGPLFQACAQYFADRTPLRITAWAGEQDFVDVVDGADYGSSVGRMGGPQPLGVGQDRHPGSTIHELCHAFGLWHEQSRPDRDLHVTIRWENVRTGKDAQFDIVQQNAAPVGAYDLQSLMHYPSDAFARSGTLSIVTKAGEPIGPRSGLSRGDLQALRSIYPQLNWA